MAAIPAGTYNGVPAFSPSAAPRGGGVVSAGPGGMEYRPPNTGATGVDSVTEPHEGSTEDEGSTPSASTTMCPTIKTNGQPCSGYATETGYCAGHTNQMRKRGEL